MRALRFVLSLAVLAGCIAPVPRQEGAQIIFLDVGQGDATLVRSAEGKVALIDAGPSPAIVSQLRRHGVDTVDIAIASHAHADHIGGMAAVLGAFPVRYYMDNGVPHTTATYRDLLATLAASDVVYLEASARTLGLGAMTLRVLPLPEAADQNNASVGVIVEYGRFRAILTGDSEVEELGHFLALGVPDVTVLKAAHHGSRDAVTPAWLDATRPEVVVISCGRDNRYGHPNPWALRYYESVASEVYRTDLDGEVVIQVSPDGKFEVSTRRGRASATGGHVH